MRTDGGVDAAKSRESFVHASRPAISTPYGPPAPASDCDAATLPGRVSRHVLAAGCKSKQYQIISSRTLHSRAVQNSAEAAGRTECGVRRRRAIHPRAPHVLALLQAPAASYNSPRRTRGRAPIAGERAPTLWRRIETTSEKSTLCVTSRGAGLQAPQTNTRGALRAFDGHPSGKS